MHVRIHFVCRMWWTKRTKGKEFTATRHKTFQWIIKLLSTQIFHINVIHEVTPMHVCRLTVTTKTKSIFVLESLNLMVWFFTLLDDERTLSLIKPQEKKKFTDWWCAVHQFLYISMEFLVFMPHHVCHWLNYGENIFHAIFWYIYRQQPSEASSPYLIYYMRDCGWLSVSESA